MSRLQQQTQATYIQEEEIRMSINYRALKVLVQNYSVYSNLARFTFYTESTLRKVLCKLIDQVAAEGKNNIFYEIDCSRCEAVFFGESKLSLKSRSDEQNKSVRNCNCGKNEIAKHFWEADHNFSWDQKKVIGRERRLISRMIKVTINSLKTPNHINKLSYTLPEIWLPSLLWFFVTYLFHFRRIILMKLMQAHRFCVREALLSNYFN